MISETRKAYPVSSAKNREKVRDFMAKKTIKIDFKNRQQLIRGGRCPKCIEGNSFSVEIHGIWKIEYRERNKKFYCYTEIADLNTDTIQD